MVHIGASTIIIITLMMRTISVIDSFSIQSPSSTHGLPCTQPGSSSSSFTDPLGPPLSILKVRVGDDPLQIRRQPSQPQQQQQQSDIRHPEIHRISTDPPIFIIKNACSYETCADIIEQASGHMKPAETTEGDGSVLRRNCRVAWLRHDKNTDKDDENHNNINNRDSIHNDENAALKACQSTVRSLGQWIGNAMLSEKAKLSPKAGCEPLQVLHYFDEGGEFVLHHDGVGRVMTVIYYLNGVAGTWFPLADMKLSPSFVPPKNRDEALALVGGHSSSTPALQPGKDGLLVAGRNSPLLVGSNHENVAVVDAGDAVAFYNYISIKSNEADDNSYDDVADWRTLHAGLPTTLEEGDKWIANHWMHAPALFQNTETHFRVD